ncbi:MAG: cytidine deaminase [Actinomycetes bacterium]|jgi:cytidine deaminase|nr:MAG: cytidine deaminase [Actinomycetota bacterium]
MTPEELAALARKAAENAYVPYSNFRVGAVVVAADGTVVTGANIENASYPASSCAEATAVNTAAAQGIRKIDTVAVACIDAGTVDLAYPCGRCRQIMAEFDTETIYVTAGEGTEIRRHTLDELLPHRFEL